MSKEIFKENLQYGPDEWEHMPYNGQAGQPCPNGCIMRRRTRPPFDYTLDGDCRVPWDENCCMNIQDKKKDEERDKSS
jgi:hypothetical protein